MEEPPKEDIKPIHEEPEYPGLKKEAEEKAKENNETKPTDEKAENKTEKADKEKKPTIVTLKEPIKAKEIKLGAQILSENTFSVSKEK